MSPDRLRRIEELFHAAREGTAEERAALLAQTDPELRREVELLLSDPGGCEFLDRPAIQNAPELVADSTVSLLAAGVSISRMAPLPPCLTSSARSPSTRNLPQLWPI
jgi:hypothetical protein